MKKSQLRILKLAAKLQDKYSFDLQEHIQQAVANAASWGPQAHGIMNFPEQLKKDNANMNVAVTKTKNSISVAEPAFNPPTISGNYTGLAAQIQRYLQTNLELFPQNTSDTTLQLAYSGVSAEPSNIAQR